MHNNCVKVWCENIGSEVLVEAGTSLERLLDILPLDRECFISAYVNNRSKDLNYIIYSPITVNFIDASHFEGARVYGRTVCFLLFKAVRDLFPSQRLYIKQSIKQGYYFDIEDHHSTTDQAERIEHRMRELVAAHLPIRREKARFEQAIDLFRAEGLDDKLELLESRRHLYVSINRMADVSGYFYGTMAVNTSYIDLFGIKPLEEGYYLGLPKFEDPCEIDLSIDVDKMFKVFQRHKQWNSIIDISTIGKLNGVVQRGEASELVKIGEALHEKEFSALADTVVDAHHKGVQLVLISGPSSSGKTTFSKRLMIQLKVLGLKPVTISIDDYFVPRDRTPLDEQGRKDYESIRAVDVDQFNSDVNGLLRGEEVSVPTYDFISGSRKEGQTLQLGERSILIVEGIHALNPLLSQDIAPQRIYRIYASALTSISMDNLSRIGTTDNRLLRRMVRDSKYRNRSALETLQQWGAVRRGEERNIFPYQDNADYMFNTALFFELAILKRHALPLLHSVPDTTPEYSEARRLIDMLDYISSIEESELPPTSILREFVGGGSFS